MTTLSKYTQHLIGKELFAQSDIEVAKIVFDFLYRNLKRDVTKQDGGSRSISYGLSDEEVFEVIKIAIGCVFINSENDGLKLDFSLNRDSKYISKKITQIFGEEIDRDWLMSIVEFCLNQTEKQLGGNSGFKKEWDGDLSSLSKEINLALKEKKQEPKSEIGDAKISPLTFDNKKAFQA